MRYRKLDKDGDMLFGRGQADYMRDTPDAVAQAVLTRLRLWTGEWWLDTTVGTPYQQAVLGTGKRKTVEPAIRARILDTQGCTGIVAFSIAFDDDARVAKISATINTEYGQAKVEGVI